MPFNNEVNINIRNTEHKTRTKYIKRQGVCVLTMSNIYTAYTFIIIIIIILRLTPHTKYTTHDKSEWKCN